MTEWEVLLATLHKFGFGVGLISWIKLLYSNQVAVGGGTCEGCPLSPLLFAVVIEPLAKYLSFKYLANTLTKKFSLLLKKCKSDFDRWKDLPLSVAGRLNIIEMVVS